jgi:flagellar protein FlaG
MKLSGMEAVNVNFNAGQLGAGQAGGGSFGGGQTVGVGQFRSAQGTDTGYESIGMGSGAEIAADYQQKIFTGVATAAASGAESKKYQQSDPNYDKMIREAVEKVNKVLTSDNRRFEISVHEKTKDILIKVIDTNTNETIKEIPPKKIVDLVVNLCEMAGIIFDEKG